MRRCCVSDKPRLQVQPVGTQDDDQQRAEPLLALGLMQLRQRALELGLAEDQVDEAEDGQEPKKALVALILGATCPSSVLDAAYTHSSLRRELATLKRSELRKRAQAAAVDRARLEQAADCDDPAEACALLVDLICEQNALDDTPQEDSRRAFSSLKLKELRQRAKDGGMSADELESAMDTDEPAQTLIEFLAQRHEADIQLRAAEVSLRAELTKLTMREVRQRAKDAGATTEELVDAMDADEPKAAMIELVLAPRTWLLGEQPANTVSVEAQLRQDLEGLKPAALLKQAGDAGISDAELDAAMEGGDPKAALIKFILEVTSAKAPVEPQIQRLRKELEAMKLGALCRRAANEGALETQVDSAMEGENPKKELIDLLVAMSHSKESRPHFGSTRIEKIPTPQASLVPANKHIMLSYCWDQQEQVTKVHDLLTKLGVTCWMDISGGMFDDIYDSMAEGVSNAAAVVCFMTQKYQESANCKLEAKFAHQSGVPIVPVLAQGDGWRASEWLGLVTAGSLWTQMTDPSQLEHNTRQLYDQIAKVLRSTHRDDDEDSHECGVSGSDAKEELERLRISQEAMLTTVDASCFDTDAPAVLHVGVPELPPGFRRTKIIDELSQHLVHNAKPVHCGFFGQGGIGKTVTGAALVREPAVRDHFDRIVWLSLGQSPIVEKLQSSALEQLNGKQMEPNLTAEERQDVLRAASKGKCVLLALDDLWTEDHGAQLNFVDTSCGSRVLISTRIRQVLRDAFTVELGKPSAEESVRILMAAAGFPGADIIPAEASEIVELCGCLPLALNMAGKLILQLDVGEDWRGVSSILRDELRDNAQASVEQGVIRASLAGLQGSERDQTGARQLFKLFGLVPEDTVCPLECLQMMYDAVYGTSQGSTSILHIRKWSKILIDRSLVLGTVDRTSLHDLVLDYAVGLYDDGELVSAHRRVVEMFRSSRPLLLEAVYAWDSVNREHAVTSYVIDEGGHHVKCARGDADTDGDSLLLSWVSDYHDELISHVGNTLGDALLSAAAETAAAAGDMWAAACRYYAAARVLFCSVGGCSAAVRLQKSGLDALAQARSASSTTVSPRKMDQLQLMILHFLAVFDVSNMRDYLPLYEPLLASEAAKAQPDFTLNYWIISCSTTMYAGDMSAIRKINGEFYAFLLRLCEDSPNLIMREFMSMCMGWLCAGWAFTESVIVPGFDWGMFGEGGCHCLIGIERYVYEKHHFRLLDAVNFNPALSLGTSAYVLGLHYGDLDAVSMAFDNQIETATRILREPERQSNEAFGLLSMALNPWPYFLGHGKELGSLLREMEGNTWAEADVWCDEMGKQIPWFAPRGGKLEGGLVFGMDTFSWCAKLVLALCCGEAAVSKEQVQSLPSPQEFAQYARADATVFAKGNPTAPANFAACPQLLAALTSEQYGLDDQAMRYVDFIHTVEWCKGGDCRPSSHIMAHCIKGRILARREQIKDANAAFEAAFVQAESLELWLLAVFALRDLKLLVLDSIGHGDHGSRRLGDVLRRLKGSAERLTELLGGGLNVAELIALDAPEAGYEMMQLCSAPADSHLEELRTELSAMKLSVLRKKASSSGIDEASLDQAADGDREKQDLVQLLVEAESFAVIPEGTPPSTA